MEFGRLAGSLIHLKSSIDGVLPVENFKILKKKKLSGIWGNKRILFHDKLKDCTQKGSRVPALLWPIILKT